MQTQKTMNHNDLIRHAMREGISVLMCTENGAIGMLCSTGGCEDEGQQDVTARYDHATKNSACTGETLLGQLFLSLDLG